jgi:NAD(P)-dependent dehydrogenase (short-subunit alcohol dehydrogenase family)
MKEGEQNSMNQESRSAIIISASSDIGTAMSRRWIARGWDVYGTYRTRSKTTDELEQNEIELVYCELSDFASMPEACSNLRVQCPAWDVLVMGSGTQDPVGTFAECDFDEWASLSVPDTFVTEYGSYEDHCERIGLTLEVWHDD